MGGDHQHAGRMSIRSHLERGSDAGVNRRTETNTDGRKCEQAPLAAEPQTRRPPRGERAAERDKRAMAASVWRGCSSPLRVLNPHSRGIFLGWSLRFFLILRSSWLRAFLLTPPAAFDRLSSERAGSTLASPSGSPTSQRSERANPALNLPISPVVHLGRLWAATSHILHRCEEERITRMISSSQGARKKKS